MQTPKKINKPKRVAKQASSTANFGMSNNFILIVCLLIAALSWLLIKLSATYTVTYDFKLNYVDLPVNMNLTTVADSNVTISFTDKGFALLKLELSSNLRQMRIKVKDYNLINEKDNFYQISTKDVIKFLSKETDIQPSNILFSKPYIAFIMEGLYAKKVSVVEKYSIKFREQYDLYDEIRISPQKITVYGPKDILDTLLFVYTESGILNEVESDQSINSGLINPLPNLLRFEPEAVTVNFKVEKFTESSFELPVYVGTIEDKITIFPKTVKVSFKIAQKDFNNINPNLFIVTTETEGIDLNSVNKLKLKITKKPAYIRDEWMAPSEVEFLIIK